MEQHPLIITKNPPFGFTEVSNYQRQTKLLLKTYFCAYQDIILSDLTTTLHTYVKVFMQ